DRRGGTGGLDIFVATRPSASEPFGTPIDISANYESGPCISPDGLELFFDSDRPGGYGYEDLWVARRQTVNDDWETPVNLGEVVNSSFGELAPRISADGLLLLFASDRPGGSGDYDIWMASRATTQDSWTTPVNLGSIVNSPDFDRCSTISPDGLELFFASARESDYGQTDIWVSTRATKDSEWEIPVPLPEPINSSGFDGAPSISADGLSLFFYSSRTGSQAADIWVTTRPSVREPWDPPVNLGPILNSPYGDLSPSISADGSTLFFCSHRPGGFGGLDIWQATIMPLPDLKMSFGTPNHLGWDVNMNWTKDASPSVSADGLTLYFESHRLFGGYGAGDLWVTTRATTDDDWGRPTPLPEPVNSSYDEATPCVSADGLSLFFSSNRPGGYGNHDLWLTTRATKDGSWGTPVNLGPMVNSSVGETKPSISADSLSLFFDSDRPGGSGSWDIWLTSRPTSDDNWGAPVPLPPSVNSSSVDGEPSISVDGLMLFFTSDRPGGYGDFDLWVTTRKSTEDEWGTPVNLGPTVNQTYEDMGPCISADGSILYYTVGGPVGFLDLYEFDLWEVPVLPVTDLNKDEMVDFNDLAILTEYRLGEASWH
ncbi:MAG: PD40 domain-containing protein, partial [candidate division Zixibacteria bacterium]|nr:PD40 domain-containing protein [candidate division Zixibacteria bacterium]